jgi:HemX protein
MTRAIDVLFFGGLAVYLAAGAVALAYLRAGSARTLSILSGILATGCGLLVVVFAMRWRMFGLLPLTTMGDALNLFVILGTAIALYISHRNNVRPLLSFFGPALAALYLYNALSDHTFLHVQPKALNGVFLAVHVGLAFLAYSLFFVASLTSLAYVFQARNLKQLHTTRLFHKLPSLEQLDQSLFKLIAYGYVFFAITFVLGFIWAYIDSDELGARWWLSAKIVRAFFMVILYSVAFHTRRQGRLRGQKLAYLVFVGFGLLLASYMVLGVVQIQDFNFWSRTR